MDDEFVPDNDKSSQKSMRVLIVGAGFSGLTLAYTLRKQGISVSVVEAAKTWGGLIQTTRTERQLSESAANGFFMTPELMDLCQDIGVVLEQELPTAKKKYIFREKLRRFPLGRMETISFVLRLLMTKLFARTGLRPRTSDTVAEWSQRLLGKAATKYLVEPFFQGIHAGDISKMKAHLVTAHIFLRSDKKKPKTKKSRRRHLSPREGMGAFLSTLIRHLQNGAGAEAASSSQNNFSLHLETSIDTWSDVLVQKEKLRADAVVLAVGTKDLCGLLPEGRQKDLLQQCQQVSLLKANVAWDAETVVMPGFGALVPRDQELQVLGVLANSHIFAGRGESYNESWILGGALNPEVLQKSQTELQNLIVAERLRLIGRTNPPQEMLVNRWPKALPHYDQALENFQNESAIEFNDSAQGLAGRVFQIQARSQVPVYMTGNFLAGIGLSQIYSYNLTLSRYLKLI